jgi:hypothetical protein
MITDDMRTTDATTVTNKVVVIGMLDTMIVRERARRGEGDGEAREVVRRRGRDRGTGGRWENLTLQVRSPYGGMFALPVEIEPDVPGAAILATAQAEMLIAVEGSLQLVQRFDARFARSTIDGDGRTDRGRPTRTLQLLVEQVREPNEQERRSTSAVWLTGVVAEPPQLSRHPELPTVQLAGTLLQVAFARPSDFPGVAATTQELVDVNVTIPTHHQDAERLLRQGNVVRVVGSLDCRMEYQGGPSVRAKLEEIDAEWVKRQEELAGKPRQLRDAEALYRRVRQRYEAAPRLYVLAGAVELLAGAPMTVDDSRAERRAFVQARRAHQAERRARRSAEQAGRAAKKAEHTRGEPRAMPMLETDASEAGAEPIETH